MKCMTRHICLLLFLFSVHYLTSCKKDGEPDTSLQVDRADSFGNLDLPPHFLKELPVPGIADQELASSVDLDESGGNPDPDNGDRPILLGPRIPNPYTLANMQQAYRQLYGYTAPVPVTHLYVRYRPANPDQLAMLLEQGEVEWQDFPMDHQLLQDGDYYQDPALGTEEIGWLYSAVPANYTPLPGIPYEVIEPLHIPPGDDLLLEGFAESLAAGALYEDTVMFSERHITRVDEPTDTLILPNRLPLSCELDPCAPGCASSGCNGGGSGGNGAVHPNIPRGLVQVQDQRTANNAIIPITNVPVRQARIVCKRWFKIWTGYTNDQGQFLAGRKFRDHVKVILKTENNHARISKIRGIRIWQVLFPVKKRLGVFDESNMASVNFVFSKPSPTHAYDRELPYWVAATTHNSVLEYAQYAAENNMPPPPQRLKLLVTNWGFMEGAGATPMFNKCPGSMSVNFVTFFIIANPFIAAVNGLSQLIQFLSTQVDVVIGYRAENGDDDGRHTSARLKALAYHELGHASHYVKAGGDFWIQYRQALVQEILSGSRPPYGSGNNANSAIIALAEMWGHHCEYFFTDRHYGNGGANGSWANGGFTAIMQGYIYENIPGGLNCYLHALERHDPNLNIPGNDEWPWIPQGLCYDLMDDRNDRDYDGQAPLDNVGGHTTSQCLNALQPDIRTVQAFRDRLLLQSGNNQQAQVIELFGEYGY